MQSGIPEKQTPGFWNNVSQCCGSAGVAEFFLSLHRVTGDRTYLEFSKRVAVQLLAKATRDREGARWIQAEHRVKPELLVAQTGYMQGASGIGIALLQLESFLRESFPRESFLQSSERGAPSGFAFPDSPFASSLPMPKVAKASERP